MDIQNKQKNKKQCFIITPIGEINSPIRKRVDQWMKQIYVKALGAEFTIIRADQISVPGVITEQILDHIIHADLVLIDYTDLNPNVMYEAAIRHITHKPFIQIYPKSLRLPFDISILRAISYDPEDLQYPSKLAKAVKKSYIDTQKEGYKVPEILPQKFDLERIVSDPVKFVEILKEHLPLSKSQSNELILENPQNISVVYDNPYSTLLSSALGIQTRKVQCPKCGVIQELTESSWSSGISIAINGPKHYICNNCGTEFA